MSRGHGNNRRRSIVRPGAGGAILRFLIGIVLLIALCSAFYLFVLQGAVNLSLPVQDSTPTAEPTELVTSAPTPVPTIEPTTAATEAPTPEPSATPVPAQELAEAAAELPANLPALPDAGVKLGLKELSLFDDADQRMIIVRGYAYMEGRDAAQSRGYLLLTDSQTGAAAGVYPIAPRAEEADLAFDEAAGSNLDQAFFRINIDVSALPDGYYIACVALENDGRLAWNYFDDSMYHFRIARGEVMLYE